MRGAAGAGGTIDARMRRRTTLAIALSSAIPLLVIVYLAQGALAAGPADLSRAVVLPVLLVGTVLCMVAGGYLVWDLGRAEAGPAGEHVRQGDQVVEGMLGTIEQQGAEIQDLTGRLDAAYHDLETANAKLKRYSFKDEVTELYNRRFFLIRLEEEISRYKRFAHPVSVVLLDLDDFKAVNDAFGHDVGDQTLRELGDLLLLQSRDINVVARYGGDEFAMLLVETTRGGASTFAERIREVIAGHRLACGATLTASLGVGSLPEDETATSGDVLRAADRALAAAKRAGKNRVGTLDAARPA
jgi:diguanylate cyclase (GGDEF)-like protein